MGQSIPLIESLAWQHFFTAISHTISHNIAHVISLTTEALCSFHAASVSFYATLIPESITNWACDAMHVTIALSKVKMGLFPNMPVNCNECFRMPLNSIDKCWEDVMVDIKHIVSSVSVYSSFSLSLILLSFLL